MKPIIVIGAGILGASTAYHLAKRGAKVIVIDRCDRGQATDAAAGIVSPWLTKRRNKAWYALVKAGARFYLQLIPELEQLGETNTGYSRVGAIYLREEKEKLLKLKNIAEVRREDAPEIGEVKLLTKEEANSLFPPISDKYEALFVSGAARVDGRALRDALCRAAHKLGAIFIKGEAHLKYDGQTVTGIYTETEEFESDQVIITAGAWAASLLKPLDINIKIEIQKGQIVHMEYPKGDTNDWPVIMPPRGPYYIVPFADGKVVAGVTHEENTGFHLEPTIGAMNEIITAACHLAPGLRESNFLEMRVGFRPYTPGNQPIIGPIPNVNNLYIANGLGASGLTIGPYLGSELAKLVLREKTSIDLEKYSVHHAIQI